MSRKSFLAIFDYGTGGLWAFVAAESADEITKKAPKLRVVYHRPTWMTDDQLEDIRSKNSFDIDAIPQLWLDVLNE